ncbi:MAG: hypothetical protein LQ346_006510 [Caloplaca aetnensis]|nr:MAG: hypothetical protein LQ346_006510 [Caloplaca aetnensis]
MNPPVAAVSAVVSTGEIPPPKMHATVSPAAMRQSQSVPPAPPSNPRTNSEERSKFSFQQGVDKSAARPTDRPPVMPRSQTVPALSIDVQLSESINVRNNSKTEQADDEESPSEICQSPSWSDYGGAKQRKEKKRREKERKEEEKKLKKEAKLQAQADLRAGKRLSKRPPPTAMETQKMPAALRRNSIISFISSHSSSGENTKRQSREQNRLSVASTDSVRGTQRSQSTPATSTEIRPGSSDEWKAVVSSVAPQLPKLPRLGWRSRSGSSGTDNTKSWGSDDAYEKELVNFAYQFQASGVPSAPTEIVLDNVKVGQLSVQQPPTRHSGALRMDRTKTDSDLSALKSHLKVKDLEQLPALPKEESFGEDVLVHSQAIQRGGQADQSSSNVKNGDAEGKLEGGPKNDKPEQAPRASSNERPPVAPAAISRGRPCVDGSSYVHKQRMHQQQLCIAGFEDEQAVKLANEMCMAEEDSEDEVQTPAPIRRETILEAQKRLEQPQPRLHAPSVPPQPKPIEKPAGKPTNKPMEKPSLTTRPSQENQAVKDPRKSSDVAPSPASRSSRVDKLLGFKRRQKPEQGKQLSFEQHPAPIAKGSRSPPAPPAKDTPAPPVPSSPQAKLESVSAQKAMETPSKARQHRRSETVEVVQPDETSEERQPPTVQSHSRTRTSSSQLLNEDLPFSRPLPRSTTAPNLSPEMKIPSAMSDQIRNESPSKSRRKSVTFDKTIEGNQIEAPKIDTSAPKAPEIVVESVSPEGIVRKTSIKRPRSNPNLQLAATNPQLPSLDFLPQLKHQPLPKRSPNRASFMQKPERPLSSQFPAPASFTLKSAADASANLPLSSSSPNLQNSPLRPESYAGPSSPSKTALRPIANNNRRRSMSPGSATLARTGPLGPPGVFGRTPTPAESVNAKPIAKLFVICCKCQYWHDLPSHLYEAMCMPKNLTRDPEGKGQGPKEISVADGKKKVAEATLETMVKCPWCEHSMSTWCCAGWTAILYLQERHH